MDQPGYVRYFQRVNATERRPELYKVEQVLESGEPLIIERKGRRPKLTVDEGPQGKATEQRWPKAKPEWVNGSVDELVNIDWADAWRP